MNRCLSCCRVVCLCRFFVEHSFSNSAILLIFCCTEKEVKGEVVKMVDCRIPGHITGLYIFAVVNLCALLNLSLVGAEVLVVRDSVT